MGISYSSGSNTITITGYSEATPCDFDDICSADKAGVYELMPATTPATDMTLTNQIRPTNDLALKIDL